MNRSRQQLAVATGTALRFSLRHVSTEADFASAAALRQQLFHERRRVTFDEALEAQRDQEGHVFILREAGTPVAVGRVLPYPSRLSSLVALSPRAGDCNADSEIGRVACVAARGLDACALILLTLGSFWLLKHTRLRRYVGYCHPKLLASYCRLGALPGAEILVPGRAEPHRIISGSYDAAATLGARLLGLSDSERRTQP